MKLILSAVVLAVLIGVPGNASVITFDFEDIPLADNVATFNSVRGGVVASFRTTDSSGLDVYQNSGSFLPPPFMGHAITNGTGFPIIIAFSTAVDSASLDFGINNLPGVSNLVTLRAFSGGSAGTLLATSTALGIPGASQFPQGNVSISAAGFDTLVLSGQQPGLAMDNLTISTVPEPDSFSMLVVAGLVLWHIEGLPILRTKKRLV